MAPIRVLFICLGNICRSPTAEGVFTKLVEDSGLSERIHVDSAGTGDWHVGDPPDRRARAEAARRGIDISGLRGRQVARSDFDTFHYVLAMDQSNYRDLSRLCPTAHRGKLHLCLDFASDADEREVPDPYYGGDDGFAHVYDLVEDAARGLLQRIRQEHGL
ncbi:MAG: low molecular weight phosphotyrosine protein phosphatase [Candidatus Hydrogenedens sp.]|nr:low molecular weight phosphotyrosine protein phosphatase [Candidatus Hydrogenedens sp.]